MIDSLFGNLPILQGSLHGLSSRNKAIGQNIANSDTPGYKRLEVSFEGNLRKAIDAKAALTDDLPLKTGSARHFSLGPTSDGSLTELRKVNDESYRNDGNNVNIDLEMANLAETNIRYNTMASLAKGKFEGLKTLIRETR
ncbi:Flagellar basal body rod protein FlgB [compost metagenome]